MPPQKPSDRVPKGVNRISKRLADGSIKVYFYHRASGSRLEGEPGSEEFAASLKKAERARGKKPAAQANGGAFPDLIDKFQKSPEYARLARKTRHGADRMFRAMETRFSWVRLEDLNRRGIRSEFYEWRDDMGDKPNTADKHISLLRRLLSFAYNRGMIDVNHARDIEQLGAARPRKDIVFAQSHIASVLGSADQDMSAIFQVALYTGLREGDLCRLRWDNFDGQWLHVKPSKTAKSTEVELWLPIYALPPLAEVIAELPRRGERMLTYKARKPAGEIRPWLPTTIGKRWRALRESLGLDFLHWHDLRGTCVTQLYEAGCTDAEVASISGHSIGRGSHLGDYAARSRQLSLTAYQKWAVALRPASGNVVALRR